jgi:hypothetical protein
MFYSAGELSRSPFAAVAGNSARGIAILQSRAKLATIIELAADESFLDLPRQAGGEGGIVYLGVYPHKSEEQMALLFNPARNFHFEIWGRGWEQSPYSEWYQGVLPLMDVGKLYSRARIVLLLTEMRQQAHGMVNNRLFEALASGATVVSESFPYLRQHELGRYVEFVSSEQEALSTFNRIIDNWSVYEARGAECRKLIRLRHSYSRVACEFIELIREVHKRAAVAVPPPAGQGGRRGSPASGGIVPFVADRIAITVGAGDGLVASYEKWWGLDKIECLTPEDMWKDHSLKIRLPAGSAGPTVSARFGAPEGGCQAIVAFGRGSVLRCRLKYWVYFDSVFDFVKGGKLPGLYGGVSWSGGAQSASKDRGFSTRLMWRQGGLGEVYAYLPSRVEFGESLRDQRWEFKRGERTYIEQELALNDIGQTNGVLRVKVDGKLVYETHELVFRTREEVRIEGVVLAVFFGGSDLSWTASKDEEVKCGGFSVNGEWDGKEQW